MARNKLLINLFIISALFAFVFGYNHAFAAPSVTTGNVVASSAYLINVYGSVNPNGDSTEVWVEYGTSSTPGTPYGRYNVGSGTSTVEVKIWIPRLQPNTTYYYRVVAQSNGNITAGSTNSFKTGSTGGIVSSSGGSSSGVPNGNYSYGGYDEGPTTPLATTNGPVSVSATSAVINGSINPKNADTKFWFEFDTYQYLDRNTKKTSIQPAGSGNLWQLVTGNLTGLTPGTRYYYRVVAQNTFGTRFGEIMYFTTSTSDPAINGASSNNQGGGTVSGNTTSGSTGTSKPTSSSKPAVTPSQSQPNSRPSFISLEYSLEGKNPAILVAEDVKAKAGENFNYTVTYKNNSGYAFNESQLKVIIPSETSYVGSSIEPVTISGNIIQFDLGTIKPNEENNIVVAVRVKSDVPADTNLIFASVLLYKDSLGVQLSSTSYLTVRTTADAASLEGASFFNALSGSTLPILVGFALIIILGIIVYTLIKFKNQKKVEQKDFFDLGIMPPTFEPIEQAKPSAK